MSEGEVTTETQSPEMGEGEPSKFSWGREGESWKTGSSARREKLSLYAEWLLLPEASREPRTKAELAEELDVSRTTLWNYEQDAWLQSELLRRQRATIQVGKLGDVMDSLIKQATNPENPRSVQAAKVILEFVSSGEEQRTAEDLSSMTDEAVLQAAAVIAKANREAAAPSEENGP